MIKHANKEARERLIEKTKEDFAKVGMKMIANICDRCTQELEEEPIRYCSECDDTLCSDCCWEGPDGDICENCLKDLETGSDPVSK